MSQFSNRNVIAVIAAVLGVWVAGCGWCSVACPDGTCATAAKYCSGDSVSQICKVSRTDCLYFDANSNCITGAGRTEPETFTAVSCGTSAQAACDKLCVNAGLPRTPWLKGCTSTPMGDGPQDAGFCIGPQGGKTYDVSCTIEGRTCTGTQTGNICDQLNTEESTGTLSATCYDPARSGFQICGDLPAGNGAPIWGSHIVSASYKAHSGACSRSSALTADDMTYGIPAGTRVPVTVAGQNLNLTTSGGHLVVNYFCSGAASGGVSCLPQKVKDLWIGLNPITINGIAFSNISFANAGEIAFQGDGTSLVTNGPGFMVSASIGGGGPATTNYQPQFPIKFVGSLGSAPYTLASTFDLPVMIGTSTLGTASAHVTMNLAGTTLNSSGTAGGVQINCGNNGAMGTWVADSDFSGGAEKTRNVEIDTSGVLNPAPQLVYQNQHYSSPFSYTIPGFAPGSSHVVRLHFAETNPANNAVGKRKFSVMINGSTKISNLDLFATVGMNKAYVQQFNINANSSGQYVLSFTQSVDSATISGIEVL